MVIEQLIETIEHLTAERAANELRLEDGIETREISIRLQIARSLASRYLNELSRSGILVKVNSRPVYFFYRPALEERYGLSLHKQSFESFEELQQYLTQRDVEHKQDHFAPLIGYKSSLRQQIEQCKAAISYPPKGLPFMIVGETGVGKSYLVQQLYEYALAQGILAPNAPFLTFNCAEFANNPELVTAHLFGYKKGAFTGADADMKGFIEEAHGGILFLDEAHRLNAEGQEKLFLFMDKGVYHSLGDNKNWKSANVRLIFATTEAPEETFLSTFIRRIPITVSIPSLKQRTENERYQMILRFYQLESSNVGKPFEIGKEVLRALMTMNLTGNIGQLKNTIMYSCAKAYTSQLHQPTNPVVKIKLKHLPTDVVKAFLEAQASQHVLSFFNKPIVVDGNRGEWDLPEKLGPSQDQQVILYEQLLQAYAAYQDGALDLETLINETTSWVNQYLDKLVFSSTKKTSELEFELIRNVVNHLVDVADHRIGIKQSGNTIIAITHFVLHTAQLDYDDQEIGDRKSIRDGSSL